MDRVELVVWLSSLREWARDPAAWVWIIKGIVVYPDDVMDRPDDEDLIEFLRAKTAR